MKARLLAVLNLAIAVFLYPLALAALIWIAWTGLSVWLGLLVVALVLLLDRTWLVLLRSLTKKRPRR